MTDAPENVQIPDTFDSLDSEALDALSTQALAAFDAIYGDGVNLSDGDVATLSTLTEGIERLSAEQNARAQAAAERDAQAAQFAERIRSNTPDVNDADVADADVPDGEDTRESADEESNEATSETDASEPIDSPDASADGEPTTDKDTEVDELTASGTPMRAIRRKTVTTPPAPSKNVADVLIASGEGLGVAQGAGVDWLGAGKALNSRLNAYNASLFTNAAATGRAVRQQMPLLNVKRAFASDLTVTSNDAEHVETVMQRAVDTARLPEGSLVAAGGWCAPSEIMMDTLELESRDGLLSIPEINVLRGGVSFPVETSFADIFKSFAGFTFTEQEDVEGKYAVNDQGEAIVGDKPCVKIDCPEFEEHRLDVTGLCITGGILARRGYPEYHARIIRGALTAHAHRVNGQMLAEMERGSTAVALPSTQAGTTAPVLTAIELQVEHYRYSHRLSRSAALEAVFPFWVHGAIRSDLSRRLGVDLLNVSDAMIRGWFTERGIAPQFVYNWQTLEGTDADKFTAWPKEIKFLLYAAGTWIRGAADIITVDSLFDSNLGMDDNLRHNDYTALFTEEGWFVAKRGVDSRVVTVPIEADGATHMGIEIAANGTIATAA